MRSCLWASVLAWICLSSAAAQTPVNGSAAAPTAVNPQGLTSLMLAGDHVYYVDNNQHVCQSYFNGSGWVIEDLTALIGTSTLAAPGSAVTSVLIFGGDHVYYFDTKQHVNQMYFTGSAWTNQDLTASAQIVAAQTPAAPSVPVALSGSAISSFSSSNVDHIFYLDPSRHINHLWWAGQQWQNEDLMTKTNTTVPAAANSGLNSVVEANGQFDIYYTDSNQHVSHFWRPAQTWYSEDLSCVANGAYATNPPSSCGTPVALGSALTGYAAADGTMRLFFFDKQPHVNQMLWNTKAWSPQDLTQASGITTVPDPTSGLTSFGRPDGSAEVYYVDTQHHINQLEWNGLKWTNRDLTMQTTIGNSVVAAPKTALTSLLIMGGNHVYYVGTDGQVHQIYWNGQTWVNQDLSTPAASAPIGTPAREYIYFHGQRIAVESSAQ